MEWFTDNPWVIWLAVALGLVAAETLTADLILLMLGIGAAAGAVTALVLPGALLAQVVVAVVVALLSLFVLRPPLLARVRDAKGYRSAFDNVVGSRGTAVREIAAGTTGEVKVNGETWTARAWGPGIALAAGDEIEVVEIDGVTAVVRPLHDALDPGTGDPGMGPRM